MIFLNVIFILICGLLMLSVLLQSGKGEGLSGTFGGSSQFMGGRAAATFLTKTTTALAAIFMVMCIVLSMLNSRATTAPQGQTEAQRMMQTAPAQVEPTQQQGQNQAPPAQTPSGARPGGNQ